MCKRDQSQNIFWSKLQLQARYDPEYGGLKTTESLATLCIENRGLDLLSLGRVKPDAQLRSEPDADHKPEDLTRKINGLSC